MEQAGKTLMIVGAAAAVVGAVLWVAGRAFPGLRLGRLPGDFVVEKPGWTFAFPVATMVLLSVVLTVVLWIIGVGRK